MQTNIETIYQTHIKPLSEKDRIKLLAKMAEELVTNENKSTDSEAYSIMELHGLGAEIWEGIDVQEYVNKLRDEWEHRP